MRDSPARAEPRRGYQACNEAEPIGPKDVAGYLGVKRQQYGQRLQVDAVGPDPWRRSVTQGHTLFASLARTYVPAQGNTYRERVNLPTRRILT